MTLDSQYPGTHFTEVVAKNLNAELISLARVGASNFYITQQVEHAITLNPDLILLVFSNYDRTELLIDRDIPYDPIAGLENFTGAHPTVSSNVITAFINSPYKSKDSNFLKEYFAEVYDFGLQYHKDYYLCLGMLSRLANAQIPFIFNHGGMRHWRANPDQVWNDYRHNFIPGKDANPWDQENYKSGQCSGIYHGSFDTHQDIAKLWLKRINQFHQKD
jgi:hypothetical protein